MTFANLCKLIHNVIIIPVSSDPLSLETGKKKKKIEYLENEKGLLDEIKRIFHKF